MNIGTDTMEAIDKAAEELCDYIIKDNCGLEPYANVYRIDDAGHYVTEENWTKIWSQYPSWWEKAWMLADNGDYDWHDVADMSIEEITEAYECDDLALDVVFCTQADEHGHC